ncbi:unnamed protein product, partial [marine sediment metagenome]
MPSVNESLFQELKSRGLIAQVTGDEKALSELLSSG